MNRMPVTRIRLPHLLSLLALAAAPTFAQPRPFDWKLLGGSWSESTRHQYACRPDNAQYRLAVSPDKTRITFRYDRPITLVGGKEVRELGAEIRRAEDHSLFLRYDKEDPFMSTGEWELRFLGPGIYRMGFSEWDKGTYNNVIGVKCAP